MTSSRPCEHCGEQHARRVNNGSRPFARFCSKLCQSRSWFKRYREEHGVDYRQQWAQDQRAAHAE